jgi:hypothetical protein
VSYILSIKSLNSLEFSDFMHEYEHYMDVARIKVDFLVLTYYFDGFFNHLYTKRETKKIYTIIVTEIYVVLENSITSSGNV